VFSGDLVIIIGNEQEFQKRRAEQEVAHMRLQVEHFNRMLNWQTAYMAELSAHTHDMKHKLKVIEKLFEAAATDQDSKVKACEGLSSVRSMLDLSPQFNRVKNKALQMALEIAAADCKIYGITLTTKIMYSDFDFMTMDDISSLFMNMFENAVEACKNMASPQKAITICIHRQYKIVFVRVENTKENDIDESGGVLRSTKTEHGLHGYGIKNIRQVAEKYGGNLLYSYDAQMFCLLVVLSDPSDDATYYEDTADLNLISSTPKEERV
jgi:sensor histidine kinase regulating citrate/malate metabolism